MAMIKQPPKYRYINKYYPGLARPTKDNLGVQISVPEAELLSGENKGEMVSEVKPNQLVKLSSEMGPRKFNGLVGYNPLLAELGEVSMNPVLEDGQSLELIIKARKGFHTEDLEYVFSLWITD